MKNSDSNKVVVTHGSSLETKISTCFRTGTDDSLEDEYFWEPTINFDFMDEERLAVNYFVGRIEQNISVIDVGCIAICKLMGWVFDLGSEALAVILRRLRLYVYECWVYIIIIYKYYNN